MRFAGADPEGGGVGLMAIPPVPVKISRKKDCISCFLPPTDYPGSTIHYPGFDSSDTISPPSYTKRKLTAPTPTLGSPWSFEKYQNVYKLRSNGRKQELPDWEKSAKVVLPPSGLLTIKFCLGHFFQYTKCVPFYWTFMFWTENTLFSRKIVIINWELLPIIFFSSIHSSLAVYSRQDREKPSIPDPQGLPLLKCSSL